MILTPRLSVYLFKIGQKLHRGEYVGGLMKCPECDTEVTEFTTEQADQHVVIRRDIGDKALFYCVVGCEGYWTVDPETLGLPRGSWQPSYEIIRERIAKLAKEKLGWDIDTMGIDDKNRDELSAIVTSHPKLTEEQKEEMREFLDS